MLNKKDRLVAVFFYIILYKEIYPFIIPLEITIF